MSNNDSTEPNEVRVSVGAISVSAQCEDVEVASDIVDEKLDTAVAKAEQLGMYDDDDQRYYVEAGAGSLMAHSDGDTPGQARRQWEKMWSQMLDDVDELSEREREQAGLTR